MKILPSKDDASNKGYRKAYNSDYKYRRVLKSKDDDIYYSGWMDCFDWIKGINKNKKHIKT